MLPIFRVPLGGHGFDGSLQGFACCGGVGFNGVGCGMQGAWGLMVWGLDAGCLGLGCRVLGVWGVVALLRGVGCFAVGCGVLGVWGLGCGCGGVGVWAGGRGFTQTPSPLKRFFSFANPTR